MAWSNRFFNLFRRAKVDAEAEEELQFHFVARLEENLAKGMPPEQARREASRQLGGELLARESARDADLFLWLDTLARDMRYALRNLAANRAVTAVAILSLALGIGANTAIFSAIRAILLRPLPYKNAERLAMLWNDNRRLGLHEDLGSYGNFLDWKKSPVFEDMAGFVPTDATLSGLAEPMRVTSALVDPNLFSVLGVTPALGRSFTEAETDPANNHAAVLSNGLWQRLYGAGHDVLSKTIEIGGASYRIVGVMPAKFGFPDKDTDLWLPLALTPAQRANRGGFFLSAVGRWKPGVTSQRARSEMSALGARLEAQFPDTNKGYSVWVVPLLEQVVGRTREALLVLLGAVIFVLLIACLNAANLFLGRGAARGREIAVRAALGAGRRRLVRQLLTESAVLSVLAGGLGLALAYGGLRTLILLAPKDLPRLDEISIDGLVLAFSLGVSLLAGIIFGILPALQISRVDLNEALREGGRGMAGGRRARRVRSALTVAEVVFSMVLLTGAGLMMRSLLHLRFIDPGFRTGNVLTWRVSPPRSRTQSRPQIVEVYNDVLARIRSLNGVLGASAISDLFLSETPNSASFSVEGHPDPPPEQRIEATIDRVSPEFFQTMGVRLVRGRFFDEHDGPDSTPVALINETMARRFWPGEDAVGKRFKFGDAPSTNPWLTVAGIAADMRRQGMEKTARCETFAAMAQRPATGMLLVIRTTGDPIRLVGPVRDAVRSVEPRAVMFQRSTISDEIGDSLSQRRFETLLLGLFALLALALAAVGIYGVVYQSVTQRMNEIGIRVALGAQKASLLRMVAGDALALVGLGAALGGIASYLISRALARFLFGVGAADPLTYAGMVLLLFAAAGIASLLPARRATSVNPIQVLRCD